MATAKIAQGYLRIYPHLRNISLQAMTVKGSRVADITQRNYQDTQHAPQIGKMEQIKADILSWSRGTETTPQFPLRSRT